MIVTIYPNGDLEVPMRAEGEAVIGDGVLRITPEHPDYERWVQDIEDERVDVVPADEGDEEALMAPRASGHVRRVRASAKSWGPRAKVALGM
jgi:hypothetical protein